MCRKDFDGMFIFNVLFKILNTSVSSELVNLQMNIGIA